MKSGRAGADPERDAFLRAVIQALQDNDKPKAPRSQRDQAASVYQKLQFDFPDVPAPDLLCLAAVLRKHLANRSLPTSFVPTNKLLENLQQCATEPPPATESSPQAQRPPDGGATVSQPSPNGVDSGPSALQTDERSDAATRDPGSHGTKASSDDSEGLLRAATADDSPAARRQAYCVLQGLLLVKCVALALELPAEEAGKFVRKVAPPPRPSDDRQAAADKRDGQAAGDAAPAAPVTGTPADGASGASEAEGGRAAASDAVPGAEAGQDVDGDCRGGGEGADTQEAVGEPDRDDEPYERLETAPLPTWVGGAPAASSSGTAEAVGGGLEARLEFIASHLSPAIVDCDVAWKEDGLVLELSKALAVIAKSGARRQQLGALHGVLTGLLTDRLTRAPADMVHLPAVLQSLGLGNGACAPVRPGAPGSSRTAAARAAAPALALCATLAAASAAAAPADRATLWSHIARGPALPMCSAVLEGVETALQRRQPRRVDADERANLDVVAAVVEFHVCAAPGGASADTLVKSGLWRPLVMVFSMVGGAPECEALRRAVILGCSRSKEACAWFSGCLPARTTAMEDVAFKDSSGGAGIHGALWPVVIAHGRAGAKLDAIDCGALCALLRQWCCDEHVGRLLYLLSLMHAISRASQSRVRWPPKVEQSLQQLVGALQDLSSSSSASMKESSIAKLDENKCEHPAHSKSAALAARCIPLAKSMSKHDLGASKLD